MASNLKSARQAIEAELAHARQGAAYYATRVEALETALQQLESVEGGGATSPRAASTPASAGSLKRSGARTRRRLRAASTNGNGASLANGSATKRSRKARTASSNRSDDNLFTGGDFWLSLVSEQPQSAVDIANAAIETLGIAPDQKDKIQKLKQRVSPALAGLVSAHKINDSGAGRERRFFKGGQPGTH